MQHLRARGFAPLTTTKLATTYLDHTGRGARDLNQAPDGVIAKLSTGTGISIERLQDMTSSRIMVRLVSRTRELLETPEGQVILDNLIAMGSRNRRRESAGAWILIASRNYITIRDS